MSVPLDRLYNFLHGLCNHDIIMYHWSEHGSKKASDLIASDPNRQNWRNATIHPMIICHDQEPLDFQFYKDSWDNDYDYRVSTYEYGRQVLYKQEKIKNYLRKYHLRSVANRGAGVSIYDAWLLLHSEQNSSELELYKSNGFIPVYYWSHALIARDWFRYAELDPTIGTTKTIKDTFLIYNRAWTGTREYRLKFAEQLVNTGLVYSSKTAFNECDNNTHYKDHVMINPAFNLSRYDLENTFKENASPSWASAEYNIDDYNSTLCEIVLETIFDDARVHVTEKLLRPIACQQPFMVLAGPGTLAYLRRYGFKTFDGIIDETYDTLPNSQDRMNAVIKEMQKIDFFTTDQRQEFLEKTKSICEHNRRWFFSKEFFDIVVDEFKENINAGLNELEKYKTGKMWTEIREIARTYYPDLFPIGMRQGVEEWVTSHFRSSEPSQSADNSESLRS